MGRFVNNTTGVIVSVDDSKDHRFSQGWTPAGEAEPPAEKVEPPVKRRPAKTRGV